MLSEEKKDLTRGLLMMGGFVIILTSLFSPIFKGTTPMHFMDNLYNSISKGSVYYISQLQEETKPYRGTKISVSWQADTQAQLDRITKLLQRAGAEVRVSSMEINLKADLGNLLAHILADADLMFHNMGDEVRLQYDSPEKLVLYDWWQILKATGKGLNRAERFEEARIVNSVLTKAVECAYNYYGITAHDIVEQAWLVVFSLIFYVVYTVWLGFAILFCLKGIGLKLEHD